MPRPAQDRPRPIFNKASAQRASYIGSAEHKSERWWGGLPQAWVGPAGIATRPKKQDTTICPLVTAGERMTANGWVRDALQAGQLRWYDGDKDFPKRIWYRDGSGQCWTGFCINSIAGHYKGWPIDEDERREIFG